MNDITIIIKTLDRKDCLVKSLKSIFKYYPDVKVLVADDSEKPYKDEVLVKFKNYNLEYYELPADSGASYGRNFLITKVKTKYFMLCDDDFVFDKKTNIESNLELLKEKKLDILGGYVRNYKIVSSFWHRFIVLAQKMLHYEIPTNYMATVNLKGKDLYIDYKIKSFPDYEQTDIVTNFFIAKTESVRYSPWDNELKTLEHTAFFIKAKKNNLAVAFTNKLSVRHCPVVNPIYKAKRSRDYNHVFFKLYDIEKIVATFDIKERDYIRYALKEDIKVSIVVPVYNAMKHLPTLTDNLLNQNYENLEIIFVDNNSKDESLKYLKQLSKKDKRIKVLEEKEQGPNYARKTGFLSSTGDYIYFCDSDDFIPYDAILNFIREVKNKDSEVVVGNYNEVTNEEVIEKQCKGIFQTNPKKNLKDEENFLLIKPALWNKLFKRNLINEDSFVMTFIGEDMILSLSSLAKAKNISYVDKVVYNYVPDEKGLSASINPDRILGIINTCKGLETVFKKNKTYNNNKEEINFIILSHMIYRTLRLELILDKKIREDIYTEFIDYLKTIDYKNNKYYKNKVYYRIASFIVIHKSLFHLAITRWLIQTMFTNKALNKLFKTLDK